MKQERVVLSFVMVLVGLLVAGIAFYFYQTTKVVRPNQLNPVVGQNPTPSPKPTIYLTLTAPTDESVTDNKTLQISGQTNPEATIVVITDSDQSLLQPTSMGNFSTTITLGTGQNIIEIESILPNGETTTIQRVVTYSTESF